ncbi:MAG: PIG-L family deacetylase [Myxococcaceae bacterium]|nr:PIG-L family deacetylase [Myxococcaceae bacterium]
MLELTMTLFVAASQSSAELYADLKKLQVVGSALYVAAHPDDENTRLLATLANEQKVRAAYLSFTRGEGGQNLIGQELGPLLGLIRTQELLAARRIDGAEQYFTRAADFGYSKSVDETLQRWNHDEVLADAVKVVRDVKPDVIITRFALEGGDTHGHHTASARLGLEAFTAAADAAFHPELGAPWAAKRIVWNSWKEDPKALTFDSSVFNPVLGLTYGELAATSRSQHKSQGFGAAPIHGPSPEWLIHLGGEPGKSLFDGVDLTWKRVAGSEGLQRLLDQAVREWKPEKPAAAVPVLLKALAAMKVVKGAPPHKLAELERLIAACAGVFVEASASAFSVVAPGPLDVTLTALVRTDAPVKLKEVRLSDGQTVQPGKATLKVEAAPWADFVFDTFTLRREVQFKWVDPTVGERYRSVELLPGVTVKPESALLVFADEKPKTLKVTVTAHADAQSGEVQGQRYSLAKKGDSAEVAIQVKPTTGTLSLGAQTLTRIEYPHIPIQTVLAPADVKLVKVQLARGRVTRIGYVPGAGDEVAPSLRQVGYEVTLLDDEALRSKPLEGYDAIVVGIRAYNVNPRLPSYRTKLMQYVEKGGTLLLQYNTKNRLSDVPPDLGPFPFELSNDRVTDETAELTFDRHPLVSKPNALGPADYEGWVQERGLYFANRWDEKYATPLSMHDPKEEPKKGALLVAKHGKGTFIYTGLAFFRQLPAGVPGAYRLFANLLAHGR